jgi:hypothetical protein
MIKINQDISIEFIRIAIEQEEKLAKGDVKIANKMHDLLYKKYARAIRALPDQGRAILEALADNQNPAVRIHAGYLLLPLNEKLAVLTLADLANANLPGISSASITTLSEWSAGRLDVEWFTKTKR